MQASCTTHTCDALNYGSTEAPIVAELRLNCLGCGSAARHGCGSAAAPLRLPAPLLRLGFGFGCELRDEKRRASRAARAPKHRANDGDRQEVESPNRASPAFRGTGERKVESMFAASREEPAARRSNSIGCERWSSPQQAIALRLLSFGNTCSERVVM